MAAVLDICTNVATTLIQDTILKAWMEIRYLRKYKSYVKDFKTERGKLSATLDNVNLQIDEAKKRNETRIYPTVEDWRERVNEVLQQDTKTTKFFGLCNCFLLIAQAKELDSLTKELIPNLIAEVDEFQAFAQAAGVPGLEYYPQEFMSFESRKAKFNKLKEALEDDNNYRIGLQGLGGTGKSTMAIEVGKHVEKSKNPFNRVIFTTVSTPIDEKGIRDDIARQLELQLEEEKLLTHAQQIWIRIAHVGKVLIILDDVWDELNLNNIGIQHGIHNKGRCCVLLTTRSLDVCATMGCQNTIKLDVLPMEDALNLFLSHATASVNDCPDDLKRVAQDIVNECGGLLVMIVAVEKALRSWPPQQWQEALTVLKNPMSSRHGIVDEYKRKNYNSLRFSYDYLKGKDAQVIFLLCSVFPKAYEIPIELLSRITIGVGLFGEVDQYHKTRSHVHEIKNKLLNSSLLLNAGEEYVKMHDVIREIALEEIDNEKIQVIMDSKTKLKESVKYSSWIIDGFSNYFDGSKLEILLIWINANEYSLEVPKTVFEGMKSLRVLLLHSKIEFGRTLAPSLPKSIQSLQDIRTLSLTNWELGNIYVLMRNLQKLESLELTNCSIFELPNEITALNKLRFLCMIRCSLEENNPFDVIARCTKLEEVYYVSNDVHNIFAAEVPQITSLPKYQIYHIDGSDFSAFDSFQLETSIKRCFKPAKLQRIFSKDIIRSLATRAEILRLEGDNETGWNNLIPGMVSIEDGALEDLINLSLISWSEMKCLIHTEHLQLKSGVTIFSKLAEMHLVKVGVRALCCGPYPDGFLKQLEKLELRHCVMLNRTLLKGKLDLGNLKSIEIEECSMTCLFHPSTAQTLRQLETLRIAECSKLEYIIMDERSSVEEIVDDKDPNPMNNDSMFPKLKLLSVKECGILEFIFPFCFCEDLPLLESVEIFECDRLRHMFGQYLKAGCLDQMQKETTLPSLKVMSIKNVPSFDIYPECYFPRKLATNISVGSKEKDKSASCNISWGPSCCFQPKAKATNKNEPSTSKTAQPDHTISQEEFISNITDGVFTPPLYPCSLRKMNIENMSNFKSLFSVSIASSMSLLEELVVSDCDQLEHIVIEDVDGHDHMNANSIFPNLRTIEIKNSDNLEYVFPASCSRNLVHLESVLISGARQLKYMFGKSCGDDNSPNQNHNTNQIDLLALNKLCLKEVPNIVSMCPENYYVKALSLQDINLDGCPQLPIYSFVDLSVVEVHKGQEQLSRKKVMGMQLCNLKHLTLMSLNMETMYDLKRLQTASHVDSSLETLCLEDLNKLRKICVGPEYHLSFQNLSKLRISGCHQMKFILSASISRSLPYLRHLWVSDCEELERIIEDDDKECCFPNLRTIVAEDCNSLKCLFSISTCGSLPQLSALFIGSAPELEQVFERKQGTTQELDIKHVFPKLFIISIDDLPKLHTICSAIDFQTIMIREVESCPNISLTSTDHDFLSRYGRWFRESEMHKGNMDELDIIDQGINRLIQLAEKTMKRDPPTAKQNNGSTNIKEIAEASDEESPKSEADEGKDSEQTNNPVPFDAPSHIESPQETMEPTSQEGSKLDEVALATNQVMEPKSSKSSPTVFVVPSENECPHDNLVGIEGKGKRITLDHQVMLPKTEHDMHPHDSQKDIETSVGERSDTMAMGSASTTTKKSTPLIPSISTSKKPQIATSSNDETEPESSRSDLLNVYITESAQDEEIKATQEETWMSYVSEKFEDDDLMKLFQIMEEGDRQDDSEVTKALVSLEASLKMGLNEIASSEESELCLENALNTLSSHCFDDGLKATIHSLQQEIQSIISSFKQACATFDTVTKLEQKEKLMMGQRSQKKEAAMTLLSEIHKTQNSRVEAQTRVAELKEQISKLQAELYSKENEIKECDIKLLSLEEQKKKSVSDTIGFMKELEAVKKERSHNVVDQIKTRIQLENMDSRWSSCLSNLKKISLQLGVYLKHKL
ncbi:hypothetical protein QN277_009681 [Acacia crassicarpa]|uniref:NB-ARC domain-containing protein n=1 Tax=Acacia crassicarpa TaxID=499986 RepID=A0AAE1IRH8_9FABA|nr:hypothetical protein QN277_009681 [Acacia crassicarpa]